MPVFSGPVRYPTEQFNTCDQHDPTAALLNLYRCYLCMHAIMPVVWVLSFIHGPPPPLSEARLAPISLLQLPASTNKFQINTLVSNLEYIGKPEADPLCAVPGIDTHRHVIVGWGFLPSEPRS